MKVSTYNNSTVFLQVNNSFYIQTLMNVSWVYITVLPMLYASIQEAALSVSACLDSLEIESIVKVQCTT